MTFAVGLANVVVGMAACGGAASGGGAADTAATADGAAEVTSPSSKERAAALAHVETWLAAHEDPDGREYAYLLIEYPEVVPADAVLHDRHENLELKPTGISRLYWFDPDPVAGFAHESLVLLVDSDSLVVVEAGLFWWPVVGAGIPDWGTDGVVYDPGQVVADMRSDAPVIVEPASELGEAALPLDQGENPCPPGKRRALVILGPGKMPAVSKSDTTDGIKGSKARIESFLNSKGVGCDSVTVIGDGDKAVPDGDIKNAIKALGEQTEAADEVIVFYEGHGAPSGDWAAGKEKDGGDYMSPGDLAATIVQNLLTKDAARSVMVISDSCFSGKMGNTAATWVETKIKNGETSGMGGVYGAQVTFVDATDGDESGHVDNGNVLLQAGSWLTKYGTDPIANQANTATERWGWDTLLDRMAPLNDRYMHRGYIMGDQTSHVRTVKAPGPKCGCGNGFIDKGEECDKTDCGKKHKCSASCKCVPTTPPQPPTPKPTTEIKSVTPEVKIVYTQEPMPQPVATGDDIPVFDGYSLFSGRGAEHSEPIALGDSFHFYADYIQVAGVPGMLFVGDEADTDHVRVTGFELQEGLKIDSAHFMAMFPAGVPELVGDHTIRMALAPVDADGNPELDKVSNIMTAVLHLY
jgi:hypothetical protein